jgi:hypothetical protein
MKNGTRPITLGTLIASAILIPAGAMTEWTWWMFTMTMICGPLTWDGVDATDSRKDDGA